MALTATASQGFERLGNTTERHLLLLPGDPGATYTRGDMITISNGVLGAAAANGKSLGRVAKTVVCPAASVAFPTVNELDYGNLDSDTKNLTLVPVEVLVAAGTPIFKATFASHVDDAVTSYTPATRTIVHVAAGYGGNDYPNGALLYVYEGTGAGQVNIVEDYATATQSIVVHRDFATALDTTSKFILLSGEAVASRGISLLGRIDGADANNLLANDGANDGDYAVFASFEKIAAFLKNLMVPVIDASAIYG